MTWLVEKEKSQGELAERFKRLINGDSILKIVGTHDGMSALIAKKVGFQALYLSGGAFSASQGLPDLGILHSREVAERAREIIRATNLPLLVDIDTGFKVAAVQIEDQMLPKKCGHLNGKKLIPAEEMAQKVKTIKEVAPTLMIVARTDALAVEGRDAAIARLKTYVEAGADIVFPEALTIEEDFNVFSESFDVPLLANMTEFGKTPYYTAEEFQSFGFSMVIYPVTSVRVAAKAIEMVFTEIMEKGTQKDVLSRMQTRKELYKTINLYDYEDLDKKIAKTILPEIK